MTKLDDDQWKTKTMLNWLKAGTKVLSRNSSDGTAEGFVITGNTRVCLMEGCRGVRVAVRWSDRHITYPCSKGMKVVDEKGTVQIL